MTPLLTPEQAANLLALAPQTLANLRHRGGGPPFIKIGNRVRYDAEDLRGWILERKRASTAG